jgi:hypothetical protein
MSSVGARSKSLKWSKRTMAIKNPELEPIRTLNAEPILTDNRGLLQAAGQMATGIIERRTEKTLSEFRNEITNIYETSVGEAVEEQTNELSPGDQAFVGDFANTMSRIDRITQQGGLGARNRALIQAETALRAAQRNKPRLATQLRQEAALVLGADPTGSTLEILDQLAKSRMEDEKNAYNAMLKHAREDLGIPYNIAPGTPEFANAFFHLDAAWGNRVRLENLYKNAEALDKATGGTERQAAVWLANREGTYQALVSPLSSVANTLAQLTPAQRLEWRDGRQEINGMNYGEFINMIDTRMVTIEQDVAGMSAAVKTQLASPIAALRTRFEDFKKTVADPNADVTVLKAMSDLEKEEWYAGMAEGQRYQLFLVDQLKPVLEIMAKSNLPSNNLVNLEGLIKHVIGSSVFGTDDLSANDRTFNEQINSSANLLGGDPGTDPRYATQQAYQNYFDGVRAQAQVQGSADTIPQELVDSMGRQWTAAIDNFAKMGDAAPELTEQFIETFSTPEVQQMLRKMAPQIESEVATSLSDFITDKSSGFHELYKEINTNQFVDSSYATSQGLLGTTPTVRAADALVAIMDPETGVVRLTFKADVPEAFRTNRAYIRKQKEWSDALTRRVNMQVTLDSVMSGSEKPDYTRAFRKIQPHLPVQGFIQGAQ